VIEEPQPTRNSFVPERDIDFLSLEGVHLVSSGHGDARDKFEDVGDQVFKSPPLLYIRSCPIPAAQKVKDSF
jgi:hypothetical protein